MFDTSGEIIYYNLTNQGSLNFPKFAKDLVSSSYHFRSSKNYLKKYVGDKETTFCSTEITKNPIFWFFFRWSSKMAKWVSARNTTFGKPKSAMKARDSPRPNEILDRST